MQGPVKLNRTRTSRAANSTGSAEGEQTKVTELSFSELVREYTQEQNTSNQQQGREPLAFKLYMQPGQQPETNPFRKKDGSGKDAPTFVNRKSMHILEQQSKKGQKYVPIHLRIDNDLKKKVQHINRIKDEQLAKQEKEMRECTFKPAIITTPKTENRKADEVVDGLFKWRQSVQNRLMEKRVIRDKQELSFRKGTDKENRMEEHTARISFRTEPTIQEATLNTTAIESQIRQETQQPATKKQQAPTKKYRNKSFNVLLDLIH